MIITSSNRDIFVILKNIQGKKLFVTLDNQKSVLRFKIFIYIFWN